MMSWSPTARRNGVSGAVRLFSRQEWRDSRDAPALKALVRSALYDDDAVIRLYAAPVVRLLEPDSAAALDLLRERLLVEPDAYVSATLTRELGVIARGAPAEVDAVLGELLASSLWRPRLASTDKREHGTIEPFIAMVLFLALMHETPAATALTVNWSTHPVSGPVTRRVFALLRDWLSLPPEHAPARGRAFDMLRTAARTLESLRSSPEASDGVEIYTFADTIVQQIYFGSGAFGLQDGGNQPVSPPDGFAEEAFSVLELLTEFKVPALVHHVVQTLDHLSPWDPRRAFLIVEATINPGDPYTYDSLAADKTIALIQRYLAEYRDVLASDAEVLACVRRVLEAFVRVGWPAAISLSYRLGDAFR